MLAALDNLINCGTSTRDVHNRDRHLIFGQCTGFVGANGRDRTERLDCWDFDGKGWGLKLPCIGMFDLNDEGKICEMTVMVRPASGLEAVGMAMKSRIEAATAS